MLNRINTNRAFLSLNEQVVFYSLYAEPRTDEAQQKCFDDNVISSSTLYACKMEGALLKELSGAFYSLKDVDGNSIVIGVRITQANEPSDKCSLFISDSPNDLALVNFIEPLRSYIGHELHPVIPEGEIVISNQTKSDALYHIHSLLY